MEQASSCCSIYRTTLTIILLVLTELLCAQQKDSLPFNQLKELSLEELMNIEITSVSKRPEKLTEAASAIQVLTREDIRRSGATNLPEALRLAPNLQVSQVRSNAWIISSRGFNAIFPNKLLVLIDGRTVYSPLFAGIFWDAQSVLLEDVERIEIISGPGGTLWGANAVNGVINIITRSANDTKGFYASVAAGSFLQFAGAVRYGGTIGKNVSYRIYAQHNSYDNTEMQNGNGNSDSAALSQAGFRIDWDASQKSKLTVLGNFYTAVERTSPEKSTADGQNILATWTRTFSERSELLIQAYFDRTWRKDIPATISDELYTYDVDIQHRFPLAKKHEVIWGLGYRLMKNEMQHSTIYAGFLPPKKTMKLFSGFIQDEISIVPDKFKLTLGAKLLDNTFSGFEIQPNVRMAWTPNEKHTLWGAISRSVRTPSRVDMDYFVPAFPLPPTVPHVEGGPNFVSEKVIAYELGYRTRPVPKLSLSMAMFINQYDDLYSVETVGSTQIYQIQNGGEGTSYGIELSGTYQVLDKWRLRGGYTCFYKELKNKPGHNADYSALGIDPKNKFLLQSITDLPANFQLDIVCRYVSELPATPYTPVISAQFNIDTRVAWRYKKWEIAAVAKNLFKRRNEFGTTYIPTNFYGKLTYQF